MDLSGWDTSNVKYMTSVFEGCNLTSLDLSTWNTSMVTSMKKMFAGCSSLTNLNLAGFDTAKVTSMTDMFGTSKSSYDGSRSTSRLANITLGAAFKFIGTDGYLPGSTWYDNTDGTAYAAAELAAVARTDVRTYTTAKPTITTQAKAMSIMSSGSQISGYSVSE